LAGGKKKGLVTEGCEMGGYRRKMGGGILKERVLCLARKKRQI